MPWLDQTGRFSVLKAATFIALLVPGLLGAGQYALGVLGARPVTGLIHATGLWAIRLLFIALAITPARQVLQMPKLVTLRRMVGVAAFVYAALHLTMDMVDKMFDLTTIVLEIVLRFYLTIGATALALLLALAATSTDGMMHRLGGRRWQVLQRFVYAAAILAIIHFFLQSKIDASEPTLMAGFLLWLMGYRAIAWYGGTALATSPLSLMLLAIASGMLTALGEASYFGLFTGIEASRVLQANLSLIAGPRPAWLVLITGLAIAATAMAHGILSKPVTRPSRS